MCGPLSPPYFWQTVKHPQKVMVWGCMSIQGFGKNHIVKGTMLSNQYIEALQNSIKLQAANWFEGPYVFQQDNAPCPTAKIV